MAKRGYSIRALTFEYHGIASGLRGGQGDRGGRASAEHRLVRLPDMQGGRRHQEAGFEGMLAHLHSNAEQHLLLPSGILRRRGRRGPHSRRAQQRRRQDLRDAAKAFFDGPGRAFRDGVAHPQGRRTRIILPLSAKTKAQVIRLAAPLEVPLELTWSCHREAEPLLGVPRCRARAAAFEMAGVADPSVGPRESGEN